MSATTTPASQNLAQPASPSPLPPARAPLGHGIATIPGVLLACAAIGLGVTALQEALVRSGAVDGPSWTRSAVHALDSLEPTVWFPALIVALAALGLFLVVLALKPRRRSYVALNATTGVFLRRRDLGRVASLLLRSVDGVSEVRVKARPRKLVIVASTPDSALSSGRLEDDIRLRLSPLISALAHPPSMTVNIRHQGSS